MYLLQFLPTSGRVNELQARSSWLNSNLPAPSFITQAGKPTCLYYLQKLSYRVEWGHRLHQGNSLLEEMKRVLFCIHDWHGSFQSPNIFHISGDLGLQLRTERFEEERKDNQTTIFLFRLKGCYWTKISRESSHSTVDWACALTLPCQWRYGISRSEVGSHKQFYVAVIFPRWLPGCILLFSGNLSNRVIFHGTSETFQDNCIQYHFCQVKVKESEVQCH